MGHVRDLPDRKAELPPSKQDLPYASIAVDIEHDFAPIYVIKETKKKVVRDLKSYMKQTSTWL